MSQPVSTFLAGDHARLEQLLRRAAANSQAVDLEAYVPFRAGLLRHIAMEEKVLIPDARRRRGGAAHPAEKQIRADHAALAALLVPPPTPKILTAIRGILETHNELEEGPAGLYADCEALAGAEADSLLDRIRAVPDVPLAANTDDPRAYANIEKMLRAREATKP
jgi:hemerythrin HHE cation binding domain-containing protein